MLVKDNKFGGAKKKTIVRVTSKQEADGFFTGDVITGIFYPAERFHWANVKLLTDREVAANKKRFIKSLYINSADTTVTYENKRVVVCDEWGLEVKLNLSEAKQLATFINSL